MASALRRSPRELGYRGRQVRNMIALWIEMHGRSPTMHEIKQELDFYDCAGVCRVVQVLESRGIVHRIGKEKIRIGKGPAQWRLRLVINNN